ncbi:hypothetical protein B0H19DRAFT_1262347 [Mycena capillaripes]|nr:hypothetical protein B0H19DRAFT_1262347 [Mycena capillaripes]
MFSFSTLFASAALLLTSTSALTLPRTLAETQVLNAPLLKGVNPRCKNACGPLIASLSRDTLTSSLCTSLVVAQTNTCYGCLAATGVPAAGLQTQVNTFVSECKTADFILTAVKIIANAATESLGGGDDDSTPQAPEPPPTPPPPPPPNGANAPSGGANANSSTRLLGRAGKVALGLAVSGTAFLAGL